MPFQQASSSGAIVVEFKKAALELDVTPRIDDDVAVSVMEIEQGDSGSEILDERNHKQRSLDHLGRPRFDPST